MRMQRSGTRHLPGGRAGAVPTVLALLAAVLSSTASSAEIWFVRHAESEFNTTRGPLPVPDAGVSYPLTALGVAQAVTLGQLFADTRVDYLYSSTRLRTLQTADAISFQTGVPVRLAPETVEVSFGEAPDLRQDALPVFRLWAEGQVSAHSEGGETLDDVRARFLPFWQRLVETHGEESDSRVVVVTHGGIIMFIVPTLCDELTAAQAMQNPIGNTGILKAVLKGETLHCLEYQGAALP
jgi:2,3-bisphosphoglycerate-dependent phosphoglycerate mutase